jgi:5-hydroxyisourate hydrolase-like protein (transthyretin family)
VTAKSFRTFAADILSYFMLNVKDGVPTKNVNVNCEKWKNRTLSFLTGVRTGEK